MHLVADVGGTNARVARVSAAGQPPQDIMSFKNADFKSLSEVFDAYLKRNAFSLPMRAVVAVAGPVAGNAARMTNLSWVVDGAVLSEALEGADVQVVNDLTALGYSALRLQPNQLRALDEVAIPQTDRHQALVVGLGTGFNVSPVIEVKGQLICASVEAGHASLPGRVLDVLADLRPGLEKRFSTVESLFAGQGRRDFLSFLTDQLVDRVSPYLRQSGAPENILFDAALDTYAELIGHLFLDLKLNYMPLSGLFLAGGVARSSLGGHRAELCRAVLRREGQFIETPVPAWIIEDDAAALVGCAAILSVRE